MTLVVQATASGEEHGLINILANSVVFDDFKHFAPDMKEKMKSQKKEDNRIVKAKYINYKGFDERFERPYCKWAGDPMQIWKFIPGETYNVPKGLVDEVNDPKKVAPKRSGLILDDKSELAGDRKGERVHEFFIIG